MEDFSTSFPSRPSIEKVIQVSFCKTAFIFSMRKESTTFSFNFGIMDLGNVEAEGTLYHGSTIFKTFLKPTLCTMLVAVKSTQIIIAIKFVNLVLRPIT